MKLVVGSIDVTVEEVTDLRDENGEELDGQALVEQGIIQLNSNRSPQIKQQTLLHELIHTIAYIYGWEESLKRNVNGDYDEFEELLCSVLTPCLYDTLKRNGMYNEYRS